MYGLHLNNRNNQRNAGNVPQVNVAGQNAVQAPPPFGGHGAGEGGAALGFQPYIRPPMFVFRVSVKHISSFRNLLYLRVFTWDVAKQGKKSTLPQISPPLL